MNGDFTFYKRAIKLVALIVLAFALARFTKGYFCFLLVIYGVVKALNNKAGPAICIFVLFSLIIGANPILIPKGGFAWDYSLRLGMLALSVSLAIGSARRRGHHRLPFIGILPFLAIATISSLNGYWPIVSIAKIINYLLFLSGIWLGTQNLQDYPEDFKLIRTFFFAIATLFIVGSAILLLFPHISYLGVYSKTMSAGVEEGTELFNRMRNSSGPVLFCGMFNHSQALGVLIPQMCMWLLCDMFFIEKRVRWPHLGLVLIAFPLAFLSRSRVALTVSTAGLIIITFFTVNKIGIDFKVKQRLKNSVLSFFVLMVAVAVALELKDGFIRKWIRKTNDVEGDARELTEAFTSSRMGLYEESMEDFRKNPVLGMGFQVNSESAILHGGKGIVLSAPIEKGLLPVMVLGETGFIGFIFFIAFLIIFYTTAMQRRLYVTVTLFSLILVSNMGEAEFFSPGGTGSCQWTLMVVGGFIIDTNILYNRRQAAKTRFYGWSNQLG